ncbi:MAG: hypothetical protein GF364_06595 [Candidatus Lokiarchaeota archaeon]|nr:hypothetical protein [Candidatus Lokiarchaeota archaeon]
MKKIKNEDQGNTNQKQENLELFCSVKNCGAKIEQGKEVKINGKIYCPICGTSIIKASLGL